MTIAPPGEGQIDPSLDFEPEGPPVVGEDLPEPDAAQEVHQDGRAGFQLVGTSLTILALLMLGFVANLTFVGRLHQERDQQVAYDSYRSSLAQGTAPVGQLTDAGNLLAPGTPVAILEIPSLGIKQVVVEGTAGGQLAKGPGHRRDTVMPGQDGVSVVFGRQAAFAGPFRHIDRLKPEDQIVVTTGQGINTFSVLDVRRPGDPVPPLVQSGKGRLVLVTAGGTPYVPNSTVQVDADLTTQVQPTPSRVLGPGGLLPAEAPMAGQTSAWIPLVFWAQGLLIAAIGVVWARRAWGWWQTWIVGLPLLLGLGIAVTNQAILLLPNLM